MEIEETNDKYQWLDRHDERRNMSDKEILEKIYRFRKIMSFRIRKK